MTRDIRERGHPVRFGIVTGPMWRTWEELLDLWIRAERAGFDMAFVTDHFLSDWDGDDGPTLEAWTLLAALARDVPRLAIGTYVTGITHRPVAVLAKQAVTVDHVSDGRLILGLGAAWNEAEHAAYGVGFPPAGDRVGTVAEALEAFRRFETGARTSIDGEFVTLRNAPFEPKPIRGHVSILIGSRRPRMMRLAAQYADYIDFAQTSVNDVRALGDRMLAACASVGRDPGDAAWIHEAIAGLDPATELTERVSLLAPLGVSVFLVNIWPRDDPGKIDGAGLALGSLRRRWS